MKKEFWTAFGQYMTPVFSAGGEKVSWLNYKTGVKNIFFRLQADGHKASVAVEVTHPEEGLRKLYFERFLALRTIFEEAVGEEWIWYADTVDEWGKKLSRIYTERFDVSVFRKEDWPALISFFKPRIIALDEFWSDAKYGFETLG